MLGQVSVIASAMVSAIVSVIASAMVSAMLRRLLDIGPDRQRAVVA